VHGVTSSGAEAAYTITVYRPATRMRLNATAFTLAQNQTRKLTAELLPEGNTDRVTWSSSKTNVAVVLSDGTVTAGMPGKATITAETVSGRRAFCVVTVVVPATSVRLNTNEIAIATGASVVLGALLIPVNSTDRVVFVSDDPRIAKVSAAGKVTAVSEGRCTISAVASSGESAACTVTVLPSN